MRFFFWQRKWLQKLFLSFIFLLSLFFFLFLLVDMSLGGGKLLNRSSFSFASFFLYYLCQFSLYLDLFFPASCLLTLVHFLIKKRNHLEIAGLQIAGFSRRELFLPFLFFSFILMLFLYGHMQWGLPKSAQYLQAFQKEKKGLFTLPLRDGSKLVFERYVPSLHKIFDAFWIKNPDEIWHLHSLSTGKEKEGFYADRFLRNEKGFLTKTVSLTKISFPSFTLPQKLLFLPTKFQPLSLLYQQTQKTSLLFEEDTSLLHTSLFHHLSSPLLLPLLAFAIFPFFLSFQRRNIHFLFYAFSLLGFILFEALLNSLLIFSENGVFSPSLAIFSLYGLSFLFFSFFYFFPPVKRRNFNFSLKRKESLSMF